MLVKPLLVRPLPDYRIYLEFSDGTKGEVDLSDLAGKGVFEIWNDYSFFEKVHIGSERQIKWDNYIELCSDSLYLKLTAKTPEEAFKELQRRLGLTPPKLRSGNKRSVRLGGDSVKSPLFSFAFFTAQYAVDVSGRVKNS